MLGDLGSASDATATAIEPFNEGGGGGDGGVGSNSGEDMEEKSSYGRGGGGGEEFGERSFGGNRWPRQETLALLKIRSDMDVAFRDASVKGPLWDEVSRKLAELGYHRSAKKCKEKFENVYKYHRRTKESRTGKSDGKTYRFFDQLQALENQPPVTTPTPTTTSNCTTTTVMATLSNPQVNSTTTYPSPHQGIATTLPTIPTSIFPNTSPIIFTSPPPPPQQDTTTFGAPPSFPSLSSTDLMSNLTSSSTSSDDEMEGRAKRKRKLKDFFDTLMKEVVKKQEDLQRRFLEAVENREKERMAREEAWRMQEMNRIHREREILAQERSVAAAKDAAVMSFLQKLAEQQQNGPTTLPGNHFSTTVTPSTQQVITQSPSPPPPPQKQMIPSPIMSFKIMPREINGDEIIIHNDDDENNNNGVASPISTTTHTTTPTTMSSSRWPKAEVHSLIKIRTSLDLKYQENGPKGPLWEEISAGMKRLGYNRNPKRCKEKWENINKYFKKVKESNKKRPEDSKTCPYFHLLDSLYRERNNNNNNNMDALANAAAPMMVRPEQQWQPPTRVEGEMEQNPNEDEGEEDEEEEEDDEEDEGSYEMVAKKGSSNPISAE